MISQVRGCLMTTLRIRQVCSSINWKTMFSWHPVVLPSIEYVSWRRRILWVRVLNYLYRWGWRGRDRVLSPSPFIPVTIVFVKKLTKRVKEAGSNTWYSLQHLPLCPNDCLPSLTFVSPGHHSLLRDTVSRSTTSPPPTTTPVVIRHTLLWLTSLTRTSNVLCHCVR